MKQLGITFIREPKEQDYGIVAVFEDLYGNLWDLVQFHKGHPMADRVVRKETALAEIIKDQTNRALWEVKNIIDCVPDELWNKEYAKCRAGNIFTICCIPWICGLSIPEIKNIGNRGFMRKI